MYGVEGGARGQLAGLLRPDAEQTGCVEAVELEGGGAALGGLQLELGSGLRKEKEKEKAKRKGTPKLREV